jgi:hypothetical protein
MERVNGGLRRMLGEELRQSYGVGALSVQVFFYYPYLIDCDELLDYELFFRTPSAVHSVIKLS